MPRQAHGRPVGASGPSKPKKSKPTKRKGLHALEAAEEQFTDNARIRPHRLGEIEDDSDSRDNSNDRSTKRRKLSNDREDEESAEGGSDLDGNEWHVGVEAGDEDSDIDSDEAFGESDEERFADFTFRGSESKTTNQSKARPRDISRKSQELNLSEADEDESSEEDGDGLSDEDDLGEDAVDLATAFDMNDEEDRLDAERARKQQQHCKESGSSDASGAESEDDEDSSAESAFSLSENEGGDDPERLRHFVDSLTPTDNKTRSKDERRPLRNLPDKPSSFALGPSKLSAADLMQYVEEPMHRQSLKMLQAAEKEQPSHQKRGIPGKLSAPLPKRQQDRLDRVAAYDQSKETLGRWVDTVKQNRRAEHVSFPLADPVKDSASGVKSLQPMSQAAAQSELESKIQEIMQESGLSNRPGGLEEDQQRAYEELQEKKMPLEEVLARRRELRMQRELMFREELRAKRIKKIKSKAYRRVHRKEKDRMVAQENERLAAAGLLNSDEERERNDRRRAEERMGARHRESKWAKGIKATGQASWNEDARMGVSDMARKDEELRRRIDGRGARGSDESGSENGSESSDEYDTDTETHRLNEKLDALGHPAGNNSNSNLANMAFMKRAEASRKAENDEEIRQIRRSMREENESSSESEDDETTVPQRQKFGGQSEESTNKNRSRKVAKSEFEERMSEDEGDGDDDGNTRSGNATTPVASDTATTGVKKASGRQQTKANGIEKKPSAALTQPSAAWKNGSAKTAASKRAKVNETQPAQILEGRDLSSEPEGELATTVDRTEALALDIFAGEDERETRKQFEKEKKEIVEEEGDQVIDNTLPGWGSWTGVGIGKREQRKAKGRFLSTIKGVAPETRRDAKLDRVVVNEKRVKKNDKYLATELPHPFESRAQYERSLRLPMGPEWSTRNHFQNSIKPRVLVKQGRVIKPMARPMV